MKRYTELSDTEEHNFFKSNHSKLFAAMAVFGFCFISPVSHLRDLQFEFFTVCTLVDKNTLQYGGKSGG